MNVTHTPSVCDPPVQRALHEAQLPEKSHELLSDVFGFGEFRDGQTDVISRLLSGRSTLAIFPTGGGKSLCYQLPALALDGLTVVISPLIALMKDQIDFLTSKSIPAARLDSTLERDEAVRIYDDLRQGRTKLLYVSPERLGNERFLRLLSQQRIELLAVDEAHCISEWGHNFRPDYLKIAVLARRLGVARVLALTATATPSVAADIARAFDIQTDDIVQTGFYRPNLELRVTPCTVHQRRDLLLTQLSERQRGPTIVYVTLQRTAQDLADYLGSHGFNARPYHAGMKTELRAETQEAFMASSDMIVVATIAFGMGIDKSNIRGVYHYNLPKSLESYMQEIGRAGRDGQSAICQLLACADDVTTLENFSYGDTPSPDTVRALVDELLDGPEQFDVSLYDLAHQHDARDLVMRTLLTYLELDDVIQSTGSFYSQFKFQPQRSSAEIFARFDPPRAAFLRDIFRSAKKGPKWFTLDTHDAARRMGEPRDRIVAAIDYLEQQGELIVQVAGVRQGYRRIRHPDDRDALVSTLVERFSEREAHDIARVGSVVAMAEHDGCLTRHLLAYFGEQRDDCGHCSRCAGQRSQPLPATSHPEITPSDEKKIRRLIAIGHEALATPRQVTRFLCGLTSPATSRARLRGRADFGMLDQTPFAEVLATVERLV